MDKYEITTIENEITECSDPEKLVWKIKCAFKQLPGAVALECFARIMTADLPHPLKAATWRVIRYSHIWWGVDDVLNGEVVDNPLVRRAFADAVPIRRRAVELRLDGWEDMLPTLPANQLNGLEFKPHGATKRQMLIAALVRGEDALFSDFFLNWFDRSDVRDFIDVRDNGILWYLTYREDQNATNGFACPNMARVLIDMGANPNHCNDLGLCWNDVVNHFVPAP